MNSSYWLATKAEVGTALDIDETTHDAWLTIALDGVTAWIESQCQRKFKSRQFTQEIIGQEEEEICLDDRPIISIDSFTDENGNAYTEASDDFRIMPNRGILRLAVALTDMLKYTIVYTAGYVTIPEDLKLACIELVGVFHQKRDDKTWNTKARSSAHGTITFRLDELPKTIQDTVGKYSTRTML